MPSLLEDKMQELLLRIGWYFLFMQSEVSVAGDEGAV
jgi:hypothetical protein